ncbi:MAG: efflux RND transporter periplasmic adaptor subunit [Gammaproteobacteria bacterium]|nr:efflux RND transporter periplasmic adaptor subunit [Gammaproteobacteria bacterium]
MQTAFFSKVYIANRRKLSLITIMLGTSLIVTGCGDSQAQAPSESPYAHQASSDILSQQSQYLVKRKFIGKVQAKQNANLGFEQAGKVTAIFVDEGKLVKQGDILAQQDTKLLLIERKDLQVQLSQNKADQKLLATNLRRVTTLNKKNYSSAQSLDELQTKQQVLTLSAQRIKTNLSANQIKIAKSSLLAPFDAVISKRFISIGEVVAAGTPAINTLQTSKPEIKVGVPVALAQQLKLNQLFTVTIAQQAHQATLLTKGLDVDPQTRTVQLRFKLNNNSPLINGQLAYLNLNQTNKNVGYWVPISALTDGVRGLWNLYILQPQQQAALFTLQSRNVEVLYLTQEKAYISGAINDGERYLSAGLHRLVPGQLVTSGDVLANSIALAEQQ